VEVGSPELLQMLFVLTCADLAAVGPGVLTSWKLDLLTRLYLSARRHLSGDATSAGDEQWVLPRRDQIRASIPAGVNVSWWNQQVDALPRSYLADASTEQIVQELDRLYRLRHDDAAAWGRYRAERRVVEYTVGTYEEITSGIFYLLTGALASKGLQILSAEIHTLGQNLVLDRFYVQDTDFSGEPPAERMEEVSRALVSSLTEPSGKKPTFRRLWSEESRRAKSALPLAPTQVRVDNSTSERYTILDIFAHDRMGLLYTIALTIFQLGLSVHVAKISTYVDQVVDVFYVTDADGQKVLDEDRIIEIRQRLVDEIEKFTSE
jgi:[protein-PII] uridylyltransferase